MAFIASGCAIGKKETSKDVGISLSTKCVNAELCEIIFNGEGTVDEDHKTANIEEPPK